MPKNQYLVAWSAEPKHYLLEFAQPRFRRPLQQALAERFGKPVVADRVQLIDVNDPCPCGSGKKYKRCCGR